MLLVGWLALLAGWLYWLAWLALFAFARFIQNDCNYFVALAFRVKMLEIRWTGGLCIHFTKISEILKHSTYINNNFIEQSTFLLPLLSTLYSTYEINYVKSPYSIYN